MKKLILLMGLFISFSANAYIFTAGQPLTAAQLNAAFANAQITSGTISGAAIDGAAIGQTVPAAGKFTSSGATSGFYLSGKLLTSSTPPVIASGFGTTPTFTYSNGTETFGINVGTGGTASSGILTFPSSTTGYTCLVGFYGASTNMRTYAVATSTTSVTVTNETASTGATVAWPASTVLDFICKGR